MLSEYLLVFQHTIHFLAMQNTSRVKHNHINRLRNTGVLCVGSFSCVVGKRGTKICRDNGAEFMGVWKNCRNDVFAAAAGNVVGRHSAPELG